MGKDAGTALIVTRDEATQRRCAEMLVSAGLDVRTAGDREAALTVFVQGGVHVIVASACR